MSGWRRAALGLAIAAMLFRLGLGFGQAVATAAAADAGGTPLVLCTPSGVVSVHLRGTGSPSPVPTETTLCPLCLAGCAVMAAVLPAPMAPLPALPLVHPSPGTTVDDVARRSPAAAFRPRAPPVPRHRSVS